MELDRMKQVEDLFNAALEVPAGERDAFVARACAGDDDLRDRVQRLLAAAESSSAERFIESAIGRAAADLATASAHEGLALGPYRLLRELGRGGMGTVWLTERADEAYSAQVAVKLVRGGFADAELARRFRAERQILAELHHPNIAALLDGGDAPDGTPYLVMEYVDGEPITDWADRRQLGLRALLDLFRLVCEAVQHAHRSLVVHRDIKPSNILVTAVGVPKLVDFGIARPLAGDATETVALFRRMTPSYASPEQIRGERITVATDVHSLGVLLHELLAGEHPFAAADASADEVRRRVTEEEPRSPSDALRRHGSRHGFSARELAGDLDNVVAKALRKEPEDRYPSVEQFSADIGRFLAGEPVAARVASVAYRGRKFVGRHKAGVAAAALLFLSLTGGLAATTWQASRAERARVAAESALAQSAAVKDFLTSLFRASDPTVTSGREITVRELLDRGTERIDALTDQPALQADLLGVLAVVQFNVGGYATAAELLDRSIRTRRSFDGPVDSMLVKDLNQRGRAFNQLGLPDSAVVHFREAIDLGRPAIGPTHDIVLAAMNNIAIAYERLGNEQEAGEIYREMIDVEREVLGPDHVDRSYVLNNYGLLLTHQGRYADAESLLRESLRLQEAAQPEPSSGLGFGLDNLGMMLRTAGRYDDAEPFLRRGLAVRRQVLGDDHRFTGESYLSLGWMLALRGRAGDHAESDSLLGAALVTYRSTLGDQHPAVAYVYHAFGVLEERRGDLDEAERRFRQAAAIRRGSARDNPRVTVETLLALGRIQLRRNAADALAILREADALAAERLDEDDPVRIEAAAALADSR